MNKFTEKLTQLKEVVDANKNTYFELKKVYDAQQDDLTQKEYQLKALTTQNEFLTARLHLHCTNLNEARDGLNENLKSIDNFESLINSLTKDIIGLELKFDDLAQEFRHTSEELRDIHQVLDGA